MPGFSHFVQLKPCPCCGSTDLLVGTMSSSSFGVECMKCHLKMEVTRPEQWPEGTFKNTRSMKKNLEALGKWTVNIAVGRWNGRPAGDTSILTKHEAYVA